MGNRRIAFRVHAIQRMFERRISDEDVRRVIETGGMIEDYEEATPYPGRLLLGWRGKRPLHTVVADNEADNEIIVITAYKPDPAPWRADFRRRKK